MVKEKQKFLDREKENNLEAEKKLAAAERLAGKLTLDSQLIEEQRIQFHDEVILSHILISLIFSCQCADLKAMEELILSISSLCFKHMPHYLAIICYD